MEPSPSTPSARSLFHRQETRWTCGAAALRMAFASFGLELSEAEIWSSLKPNPLDRTGVNAARLAWEAHRRGFAAVVVQARDPWRLLSHCIRTGIRVVLQHPLSKGTTQRHFSFLTNADDERLTLHDPQFGPDREFGKTDWLELWGAAYGNYHAVTNQLVAIARPTLAASPCSECREQVPTARPCPICRASLPLQPEGALGCLSPDCSARLWEQVACPSCMTLVSQFRPDGADDVRPNALETITMANGDPFQSLNAAMQDYQRRLSRLQHVATDDSVRDVLGKLQESMKLATDKLGESLNRFEQQNQERAQRIAEQKAKAEQRLAAAKQAKEEAQAKLAAKKAAKSARVQPRAAAEDPLLGAKLRDRLLQEFGTRVERPPAAGSNAEGLLIDFDPHV